MVLAIRRGKTIVLHQEEPPPGERKRVANGRTKSCRALKSDGAVRLPDGAVRLADSDGQSYEPDELEFMQAVHRRKTATGNYSPSWDEILLVADGLGYSRTGGHGPKSPEAAEELTRAMKNYCRDNRRRFPTCCEVLTVLKTLRWRKI